MRNLAGRLNRRSLPDLEKIASEWLIPISGSDRHAVVGQLYRDMRDLRAGRDCWDRLDPDEQAMVRLLAVAEQAPEFSITLGDLATQLQRELEDIRATAISLYRKGILASEGSKEEIPVGEEPRVFLPRELAILFRRIQDELDAGDTSRSSLSSLIELLDDGELEHAIIAWGGSVAPGLDTRTEMANHLIDMAQRGDHSAALLQTLGSESREIWELVQANRDDGPLAYEDVLRRLSLTGDSAVLADRRRDAFAEIEGTLLVWHMYRPDHSRWLFVPRDVRKPEGRERAVGPAIPLAQKGVSGWGRGIHPYAVAWDVLTLVRELTTRRGAVDAIRGRVQPALWNTTTSGDLDQNYLRFLETLAIRESVVEPPTDRGARMKLGAAWNEWRGRSFADQMGHLMWTWTSSIDRIEGSVVSEVAVERASWPPFRRKIVIMLATLDQSAWYRLDDLSAWIVDRDPDLLGRQARVATARTLSELGEESERFLAAVGMVVRETIETAFRWFGFVEFNEPSEESSEASPLIRISDALMAFERADPMHPVSPPAGPPLRIGDDLDVEVLEPTPVRVWALSAFADLTRHQPAPRYQISAASMKRALDVGFRLTDVTSFLTTQSRNDLPGQVMATLEEWAAEYRRVWIYPQIVVDADDRLQSERIRELVDELPLESTFDETTGAIAIRVADDMEALVKRVVDMLSDAGFTVQSSK